MPFQHAAPANDSSEWQTVGSRRRISVRESSHANAQAAAQVPEARKAVDQNASNGRQPEPTPAAPPVVCAAANTFEELGADVLRRFDEEWSKANSVESKPRRKGQPSPAPEVAARPNGHDKPSGKPSGAGKTAVNGSAHSSAPAAQKGGDKVAKQPATSTKAGKNGAVKADAGGKGTKGKDSNTEKAAAKPAKTAKPTPPSVKEAAAKINLADAAQQLTRFAETSKGDDMLALQMLGDWLGAQLAAAPFRNTGVHVGNGMTQSIRQPWHDLPQALRQLLCGFVSKRAKDKRLLFFNTCMEQVSGGGLKPLGQVLVLAAIARAEPGVLLMATQKLISQRGKLLQPGRIMLTLWVLAQAADESEAGRATALHVWCRFVLPCITLAELPAPTTSKASSKKAASGAGSGSGGGKAASVYHMEKEAMEAALAFLRGALLQPGMPDTVVAGVQSPEGAMLAVVPHAAAESAWNLAVCEREGKCPQGVSRAAVEAVAGVAAELRDLSRGCTAADALKDVFGVELARACDDPERAAKTMIDMLVRHGKRGVAAWAVLHKGCLSGTEAVLKHCERNRGELAALTGVAGGGETFERLLFQLMKAQEGMLKHAKGGRAQETAKRVLELLEELSNTVVTAPSKAWLSLLLLAGLVLTVVLVVGLNPGVVEEKLTPVVGSEYTGLLVRTCTTVVERMHARLQDVWSWFIGDD